MPSKLRLRNLFKSRFLVKNIARFFGKIGFKPNQITFLMLISSILGFITALLLNNSFVVGVFIFLTLILDGVDGTLARMTNQVSSEGGFLDSVFDRVSEVFIILGLSFGLTNLWIFPEIIVRVIYFIMIVFSIMISYVRSRASVKNTKEMDIGLFARSERLFTIFILCMIPIEIVFTTGMIILTGGIIATAIYRIIEYGKMLQREEEITNGS